MYILGTLLNFQIQLMINALFTMDQFKYLTIDLRLHCLVAVEHKIQSVLVTNLILLSSLNNLWLKLTSKCIAFVDVSHCFHITSIVPFSN